MRVFLAGLILTMVSCSPESPKRFIRPDNDVVMKVGDGTNLMFNPRVDILFVVDDSGSMDAHQKTLAKNIRYFVDELGKDMFLDYHIGVTTVSVGSLEGFGTYADGRLQGDPKYVERKTPHGLDLLAKNLLVGIGGGSRESVFLPTQLALSPPLVNGDNAGFYRQEAALAIIFITDASDQSNISAITLYNFLIGLKPDSRMITAYGIIIPSSDDKCPRDDGSKPTTIEDFLQLAGGVMFSLCDPDYGSKIAGLGMDLVTRVSRTIRLSVKPVLESIVVKYGTQTLIKDLDRGWAYDPTKNVITLGHMIDYLNQPEGTKLQISFKAADESQ